MIRIHIIIYALLLLIGAVASVCNAEESSDIEAVKTVNQAYYESLSARDIQAMERVWSRTPRDVNIAPPIRPIPHVGWQEIRKNYEQFWGTLESLTVSMDQPNVIIEGTVAWVYGIEKAQRRGRDGQFSGGSNFGTSIFVKEGGRWLMVFHQAALIPQ